MHNNVLSRLDFLIPHTIQNKVVSTYNNQQTRLAFLTPLSVPNFVKVLISINSISSVHIRVAIDKKRQPTWAHVMILSVAEFIKKLNFR